jgi:formylglycine-generating enzyme required for sulfatase activity
VRRAVANDAERRFQSAGAMRSGLTFPKAKRSSSPMPLIALGLAAVVAAVYFVIGNPFVGEEESTPDKEKTEKDLAGLAPGVSGLRVTIDPPNVPATIRIADQVQEIDGNKTFFEALTPGRNELIVQALGYQTYSARLPLEEGWNSHPVRLVVRRGGLVVRSDPGVKVVAVRGYGSDLLLGETNHFGELVAEGILAVGDHNVSLSKTNRISVWRNVRLVEGKAFTLDEPLVAVPGKLSVTASPPGVVIHLDGVPQGAAPLELSDVAAEKDLNVTASLAGYREVTKSITLEAAGSQTIDFGALVKESGNLVVKLRADLTEDPATKMFLDDADVTAKAKRDTPGSFALEELSVGSRAVKVTHPNFLPWTETIAIRDAETAASEAMMKPKDAELRLEVSSDNPEVGLLKKFSLFAGGKEQTPEASVYLLPAEKEIVLELKADGHRSHTETLTFTANQERLLKIELEEVSLPVEGKNFMVESIAVPMIWVKPGAFEMGSSSGSSDETPHMVTLTQGFYLGQHEVTQAQWQKMMGSNPSSSKGADRPVETVSWTDVTSFCDKLTALERRARRLPAGMSYQLPTEAQWEYACRAGTKTRFAFGDELTELDANFGESGGETTDVGKYPANGWGFYDMHGNVWEWCVDWYGDYPRGATRDPLGPAVGSYRVTRGGSRYDVANDARSADRGWYVPADSVSTLGFRLSLRPAGEAEPQVQVPEKPSVAVPVKAGAPFTIRDLALDLLWVKPGTFEMGSPVSEKDRDDNETPFSVTLIDGYWLGKHEVTQTQWQKVMGSNPSRFKGVDRPVETVSWTEVTSFCAKLTASERAAGRLPAGMTYQLPTEAQWEYACRAGTKTAFSFGDSLTSGQANISGGPGKTTDVGKYPANGWGFHDMHGNVWEWCADRYGDYPQGAVRDPVGHADGSIRVLRGGSWFSTANYARSADRYGNLPAFSSISLGFRLSLRPVGKADPQVQVPDKAAGAPFTIRDLALEMLWVKPGTFEMGSSSSEKDRDDDETRHTVTLTQGFWLGKYEVTQAQWQKVMGSNPSRYNGADRPVENVSWTDVTSFCDKLTALERKAGRLPAGMAYQLPTEAQWEYACRAGTKTAFSFGNNLTSRKANISFGPSETTAVGKYPANAWGFHDMHGNVWEWCADWYGAYPTGAARDPVGPADGSYRVSRGGSWLDSALYARSAYRFRREPALSFGLLGFRLSLRPASK